MWSGRRSIFKPLLRTLFNRGLTNSRCGLLMPGMGELGSPRVVNGLPSAAPVFLHIIVLRGFSQLILTTPYHLLGGSGRVSSGLEFHDRKFDL